MKLSGRSLVALSIVVVASGFAACDSATSSDSPGSSAAAVTADSPAAQAVVDDLRARFKQKVSEPRSSTDEAPPIHVYDVILPTDAQNFADDGTSLVARTAPAPGTGRTAKSRLSKTATGGSSVADERSGVSVEIRPLGVAATAAESAGGYVVYRGARSKAEHLVRRASSEGVEDFFNFESAPAIPAVEYELSLSLLPRRAFVSWETYSRSSMRGATLGCAFQHPTSSTPAVLGFPRRCRFKAAPSMGIRHHRGAVLPSPPAPHVAPFGWGGTVRR